MDNAPAGSRRGLGAQPQVTMLLAIDIGNTNIVCGIFADTRLAVSLRLATWPDRTADELWVVVSQLLANKQVAIDSIDDVVLSSVVPALTRTVVEMVEQGLGRKVLEVDARNAGLPVRYDNPEDVGADRLVNGVAARALYGARSRPVIVVDFGTATTFDAVSPRHGYMGGVICPGLDISADALFQRAARLPRVEASRPHELIGRTTVASMQSGLFFGHVAMVEGIVGRLRDALRDEGQAVCIATGGLAGAIAAETDVIDKVNLDLTLTGLRLVWECNAAGSAGRAPDAAGGDRA